MQIRIIARGNNSQVWKERSILYFRNERMVKVRVLWRFSRIPIAIVFFSSLFLSAGIVPIFLFLLFYLWTRSLSRVIDSTIVVDTIRRIPFLFRKKHRSFDQIKPDDKTLNVVGRSRRNILLFLLLFSTFRIRAKRCAIGSDLSCQRVNERVNPSSAYPK